MARMHCAHDRIKKPASGVMKWTSERLGISDGTTLPISSLLAKHCQLSEVTVAIGDQVTLLDYQAGDTCRVKIVAPEDCDPNNGIISCMSPLGASLLGARIGEAREVRMFGSRFVYQIMRIGRPQNPEPQEP